MTRVIANILFLLLFLALTLAAYWITFFVDYSQSDFTLLRVLMMAICFFYFFKLTGHISFLVTATDKLNKYPSAKNSDGALIGFVLFIVHLVFVNIGGEKLNNFLVDQDGKETIAIIKDCYKSKGTEYCVYAYTVDKKHYEHKYCNEPANLKFTNNDTTLVIYYSKYPVISRLKKQ